MCAQKSSNILPYAPQIGEIFITTEMLAARVAELGEAITSDYKNQVTVENPLILIGVLKGIVPFVADLMRHIALPLEIYFLDTASYATESRETLNLDLPEKVRQAIHGRQVLFVEDIINAGLTLNHLTRLIYIQEPASLEVCAMFDKQTKRIIDTDIKYVGFELQDQYLVGYGLDDGELHRNLPYVALLARD